MSDLDLNQIYDLIVFDWDGTAVYDRHTPRSALLAALEDVLCEGALCVVITGTKIENVVEPASDPASDLSIRSFPLRAKRSLFFCVNRGSEVFSFDDQGELVARFLRRATELEDQALDQAARSFASALGSHGLEVKVISNRLNRRKIDLIPTHRWAAPKKSELRELFIDVQKRLQETGLKEGLAGLLREAVEFSQKAGLRSPKVTSDVKHIEIGLTDKRDAAYWIFEHIVKPRRIPQDRIVFFGDEYGSIGGPVGIAGSDAWMRILELADSVFVSVGVEPEGVPSWVHAIGGGPSRFVRFLSDQAALRRRKAA